MRFYFNNSWNQMSSIEWAFVVLAISKESELDEFGNGTVIKSITFCNLSIMIEYDVEAAQ